jgi:hypothetical protein
MIKRILDASASDFAAMNAAELAESIRLAEGRTLAVVASVAGQSPVDRVTHAELAASMGADLVILDQYDYLKPRLDGLTGDLANSAQPLRNLKRLVGRPVGLNLVVADEAEGKTLGGRWVTPEHMDAIVSQGADIVFISPSNPRNMARERLCAAAQMIRAQHLEQVMVVANPNFPTPPRRPADLLGMQAVVSSLLQSGCHGIALPLPGSKQGWEMEPTARLIDTIHEEGGLAWLLVTSSVEGAPLDVIQSLALQAKMLGADVYRLDEAGMAGIPSMQNILAFSLTIRGERHTYRRMAMSPLR